MIVIENYITYFTRFIGLYPTQETLNEIRELAGKSHLMILTQGINCHESDVVIVWIQDGVIVNVSFL
jgi:hypothetical protein